MKQLKPNFFIIGAPKCGTTSLSVYLSEHQEIVMSHPKEPHYFSTDIENGRMTDQSKYLACFAQDKTLATAFFEGSYVLTSIAVFGT